MSQLYNYRQGWQSENLASYILSKFSFVSQPSNVSDDIGTDFYCTLFKIHLIEKANRLSPIITICVQIKSDNCNIDLTNKINYLRDLMLPFFIGVVNKKENKLTLYSGDMIPIYFSHPNPNCETLIAQLMDGDFKVGDYIEQKSKNHLLPFFKIKELDINDDYLANPNLIKELIDKSIQIQEFISSKFLKEFCFSVGDNVIILGNRESGEKFRMNFLKRFTEYLYNLFIIKDVSQKTNQTPAVRDEEERILFLKFYQDLNDLYKKHFMNGADFPDWVTAIHKKLL